MFSALAILGFPLLLMVTMVAAELLLDRTLRLVRIRRDRSRQSV
jgi:hypothetical protein